MTNWLNTSAFTSLGLQVVAGLIEIWGLTFPVSEKDLIVRDVLVAEVWIEVVEFIFYSYLVGLIIFSKVPLSITSQRYIDWLITTPFMLINFAFFFMYRNNKHQGKRYTELLKQEAPTLIKILVANFLMMACGLLGELGILDQCLSTGLGFIPFAYIFMQLYSNYVGKEDQLSLTLFYIVFAIWGSYGVGALLPFATKNTCYNILDLISKNAFGVFVSFYIAGMQRSL
jgi:bacteriorhodopsin